jgi:hypothetical protein
MQAFHVHYRNTQGTLMRILTAVSRRALDITYVHAEAGPREQACDEQTYKVTLLLEVNPKQVGQLRRDWFAIMDVDDVRIVPADSVADPTATRPATGRAPSSSSRSVEETARAARA